jgi:hypothetical protein
MRIITILFLALFASVATQRSAFAADGASIHAILITASKEKAPADPKLAPYEATLQRNVPESSFRLIAEGSASVSGAGRATISLGGSHHLELESEGGGRLKVQWMNGSNVVISTTLSNLQPGVPTLLGHRGAGDGDVPIVLVIAK